MRCNPNTGRDLARSAGDRNGVPKCAMAVCVPVSATEVELGMACIDFREKKKAER